MINKFFKSDKEKITERINELYYAEENEEKLWKQQQEHLLEIKRLHSIIKEVRKYIENIETDYSIGVWNKENEFIDVKKDILEILEKEKENA